MLAPWQEWKPPMNHLTIYEPHTFDEDLRREVSAALYLAVDDLNDWVGCLGLRSGRPDPGNRRLIS